MPRLDPAQLLNCLSVLLSPDGGIKSKDVVQRLAKMMTQFSKKLVSKCIYIQILKCTETELLGLFMAVGGWRLVHLWLTESIVAKNWPLVRELLELLLLCPVDLERLKTNNCPKLVKELSKDGNHLAIRALASKLVEQWLKTVQGEKVVPILLADISKIISDAQAEIKEMIFKSEPSDDQNVEQIALALDHKELKTEIKSEKISEPISKDENDTVDSKNVKEELEENEALPVLKITVKDGKQVLTQVETGNKVEEKPRDKSNKSKDRDKSHDKSSSSSKSSSKHSSSKSLASSSDKQKSKHSSSSKDNRRSSSSSSSSKDKSRDKDRHSSKSRSESSKKSTSSSSKHKEEKTSEKEKVKDKTDKKDKDDNTATKQSDEKNKSPSIHKLGKIPKLSDSKKDKPSISIEVRKPDEPKPKTVKTFNSKFRKHGLEEEIKPPPSRAALLNKKVPPVLPPTVAIPKRSSPLHNDAPPEKKPKTVEALDKPGAIKLIPAKPKPILLLESDMFMDALNASATNKKEPKKRKRRTSNSKDGNAPNDGSPPTTPTPTSPTQESKSVPPRFYQDTLESDENKEKSSEKGEDLDTSQEKESESNDKPEPPHTLTVNGLKGVLCYHKKKGAKKSIKWKPDTELEEIQYFELDETERVNVTKTFTDMKYLEIFNEREAVQKARNLPNDDVMEEKTMWRPLLLIDAEGQIQVEHGKNSKEKDIQAARQKGTLQPLYFHKSMIPDSPFEPELETHVYSEPTIIPLDDITGNQDNISDFRNMPWPEPKGNAPPSTNAITMPNMFPPGMPQFPNSFPPTQFTGVPGFQGPHMVPGDWPNGGVPSMIPNGIGGPMPPTGFVPGTLPPGMVPPDANMMMGPGPEMFPPGPMFPLPDGFNMQQNMFPMEFNMPGAPGPEAFQGPQSFRGPVRGRGGHWRGKGGGGWDNPQRGRGGPARGGGGSGGARKNVCIYFQRKGSCRQGDKCGFLHPGVNGPY